jgi:ATP-binding cassette subfamily B protein
MQFVWPLILQITVDSIIGDEPLSVQGWLMPIFSWLYELAGGRDNLVRQLWLCTLLLVLVTLLRGAFLYLKGKWSAIASESIVRSIRDTVYNHLNYLSYDYHVKLKTGDLIQRCTSDVETIRRFLAIQFVEIGRALFMVGIALSFMLPMSVNMTLVSLALIPIIFSFAYLFFLKVKKAFQLSDESEGRLSTVLQENLTGVRVVRAFARQNYEIEKFDKSNSEYRDLTYRLIRLLAYYWSISDFLCLLQISMVLIVGTYWVVNEVITLGMLLAFSSYVGMMLWPIRQMGRVLTDMGKTFVAVQRIQEILDEPTEEYDENNEYHRFKGAIEFKNVWFEYEKDNPVLSDISFKVEAGQTVAILGHTGAGKTSLVHLLPRLYDYQKGSIKIDGIELKSMDKKVVRRNIGIVLQEPFLFSKTIKENIALAKHKAEESEIYDAARSAAIHDVIRQFEQGYETSVGERGVTLSGGQKQRLAIARALINDPPIMIFDDSLSAVDMETDAAIRKELQKRSEKATTFIISHRLTTLSQADLILVLDHGKLVQFGNHEELLSNPGLYQKIWDIQNNLDERLEKNGSSINEKIS